MVKTVIHCEYGGHYEETSDGFEWNSKKAHVYPLTFNTSIVEDITFVMLVNKICWKLGIDGARNKLKLSYIPLVARARKQSYILDDDDVDGYLSSTDKGECRSALHVELDKSVEEGLSSVGVNYGEGERSLNDGVEGGLITVSDEDGENEREEEQGDEEKEQDPKLEEEVGDEDDYEKREQSFGEDDKVEDSVDKGVDEFIELPFVEEESQFIEVWGDGTGLELGQEFKTKEAVQNLVLRASLKEFFDYHICESDTWRFVVKCREVECPWYLRVSRPEHAKEGNPWVVKGYMKMHCCSRATASTSKNKRKGTPQLVASVLEESFPGLLEIPTAKAVMGIVHNKAGVYVSHSTAWRGKKKVAGLVRGNEEESYKLLPSYLHVLEELNIGTKTSYLLDEENRFKYLFVGVGACIEGFKAMRKVICVDATFLVLGGVLVFATAQDPNHHHYPIAFGVIDGEKDVSWKWFFSTLKTVVPDDTELVFLSDRNASLIKAISEVYPMAEHGYCVYHLSQNVRAKVSAVHKEECVLKFREIARIYTEIEFKNEYGAFRRKYPKAAEYLDRSVEESKWARCYFRGARYNIDTTNSAESLNSVFKEARKLALLPMIDAIIGKIAEWFNKYRKEAIAGSGTRKMVPAVENELHVTCKAAKCLTVHELNMYRQEYCVIGHDSKNYLVDLKLRTCTCKRFDIDMYPCVHAIAAVLKYMEMPERESDIHVYELCSKYYWLEQWVLAYHKTIYPVPHQCHWVIPAEIAALYALRPDYPKKKGRNQENMFKSGAEGSRKRKRKSYKPILNNNLYKMFNCSNGSGTA